ncbi:hypothetical protein E4L96_08935, partial [Massilia arenosa]
MLPHSSPAMDTSDDLTLSAPAADAAAPATTRVGLSDIREAIARVEAEAKASCAAESRASAEARARALAEERAALD